jgi:Uma2 family endonuclease
MTPGAPAEARYTAARYLALVDEGVLGPDDRVELLEGVIVAMSPQNPPHASAVYRTYEALRAAIGTRALVRVQLPLVLGSLSVPEPDIAIDAVHPTGALLVEVADPSLADRLTKAAIYAAAGIAEYWIVNLREDVVEVSRDPDRQARCYRETARVGRGERIVCTAIADVSVVVDDLLPGP